MKATGYRPSMHDADTPGGPATGPLPIAAVRALWSFDDPVASEHAFADAAASQAYSAGQQAELRTQQARALGLQQRFDEADELLDRIASEDDAVRTRVDLERGRLRRSAGRPAEAVPLFVAAHERADCAGLAYLAVDALHMLALADPDNAPEWTVKALDRATGATDPETRAWAIALHNNRGWYLHDANRFDEALAAFQAAHAAALELGTPDQEQIARWAVARCLRSLGRTAEALAIQEALLEERPDDEYVHEELALLRAAADGAGPQE